MNPYELREKFHNLATANTPWYKIVNRADLPTQIHLFNTIGGAPGSTSANQFISELDDIDGPVQLLLNSEGGEVFQAKPIYNALSRRQDVEVIVDGIAASAASFIAMAASPGKLYMSRIASMMIHDGHAVAYGNAQDLVSLAGALDRESDTIASIYAERTGRDAAYFRDKMRVETWYNAEQALAEKLCDGIIDARTGKITNSLSNAAAVPYVSERQTRHEPMTGRHHHDHASFGEGDHDDGQHHHWHVHQNDADHDHEHGPGMGREEDGTGDRYAMEDVVPESQIILATAFPEAVFYNRTFTAAQRKKLAAKGHALRDGSYPIENCEDAENARRAYGRAPEGKRAAVAAHIRKRESALSCKTESFHPGSDNTSLLVISDEELAAAAANLRL